MEEKMKKIPPVKEYSGTPLWPVEIIGEGIVILLTIAVIFFLAALLPASVGEKADAGKTISPLFPEWYFLPVYGFVRFWRWDILFLKAKLIGVLVLGIIFVIIFLLPFYDRWNRGSGEGDFKHVRRRAKGAAIAIALIMGAGLMAAIAIMMEKGILTF